jgi:hypothetical protein
MEAAMFRFVLIVLFAFAIVAPLPGEAQQRPPQAPPAGGQGEQRPQAQPQDRAPTPSPPRPYKRVAITLPKPVQDQSFEAFRRQLAGIADRKDRAALARLIAQSFFWEKESGDGIDKNKSAIDNLAAALGLDAADGSGWEGLAGIASIPIAAPLPDRKGVICAPADPTFDEKAFEELTNATQTEPFEWGYPMTTGVEVRAAARPGAQVIEKLGLHLVRIMPEDAPSEQPFVRIVTPSGRTGYVAIDAIAPFVDEQFCYVKEAGGWKIAGYLGEGAEQQ